MKLKNFFMPINIFVLAFLFSISIVHAKPIPFYRTSNINIPPASTTTVEPNQIPEESNDQSTVVVLPIAEIKPTQTVVGLANVESSMRMSQDAGKQIAIRKYGQSPTQEQIECEQAIAIKNYLEKKVSPGFIDPQGNVRITDGHHRAAQAALAMEKYGKYYNGHNDCSEASGLNLKIQIKRNYTLHPDEYPDLLCKNHTFYFSKDIRQSAREAIEKASVLAANEFRNSYPGFTGITPTMSAQQIYHSLIRLKEKHKKSSPKMRKYINDTLRRYEEGPYKKFRTEMTNQLNSLISYIPESFDDFIKVDKKSTESTRFRNLNNSPLRAIIGKSFDVVGMNADDMRDYVQLYLAEILETSQFHFPTQLSLTPPNEDELHLGEKYTQYIAGMTTVHSANRYLLGNKMIVEFLKRFKREGRPVGHITVEEKVATQIYEALNKIKAHTDPKEHQFDLTLRLFYKERLKGLLEKRNLPNNPQYSANEEALQPLEQFYRKATKDLETLRSLLEKRSETSNPKKAELYTHLIFIAKNRLTNELQNGYAREQFEKIKSAWDFLTNRSLEVAVSAFHIPHKSHQLNVCKNCGQDEKASTPPIESKTLAPIETAIKTAGIFNKTLQEDPFHNTAAQWGGCLAPYEHDTLLGAIGISSLTQTEEKPTLGEEKAENTDEDLASLSTPPTLKRYPSIDFKTSEAIRDEDLNHLTPAIKHALHFILEQGVLPGDILEN